MARYKISCSPHLLLYPQRFPLRSPLLRRCPPPNRLWSRRPCLPIGPDGSALLIYAASKLPKLLVFFYYPRRTFWKNLTIIKVWHRRALNLLSITYGARVRRSMISIGWGRA